MKTRIVIIFLLLPVFSFCQKHINQSRAQVKKELKSYKPGTVKPLLTETDSSITMTLKKGATLTTVFIYEFDEAGKCKSEKVIANCDSCINKMLRATLKTGKHQWKKINETQYVSRFEDKLMIELPVENKDYSYSILRMDWNRIIYDLLIGK